MALSLFDLADQRGIAVPTSCGRKGTCHECIVEVKRGGEALSPPTETEGFLRGEYRLACQARLCDPGVDIEFAPFERRPKILIDALPCAVEVAPLVSHAGGTVFYDGEPVDAFRGHLIGVAVDAGTTTIVLEAVDFQTGAVVYRGAFENPQRFGGSDVMHRISYDAGPHHGQLHRSIIAAVNQELKRLCQALGIERQEIYEMAVAGNSTMRDLFFGLDVQPIGQWPYKSRIELDVREGKRETTALVVRAHKLGLWMHPQAGVYGAPLIASHVGADAAADLVATEMASCQEPVMLVDIGTNTEVIVGHGGRWIAASCPAGPAFEGGLVRCGMPGCDGAIEALRWNGDSWRYRTIGDRPAEGICGSGLIDLLAQLRRHDLMTPKGVFAGKARDLTIVPERGITFSREDASHLAQAKAANFCGQYIVLREAGLRPDQIQRLYLAGGFANYIDVDSARQIGFVAPVPPERVIKAGNAAVAGARQILLSRHKRKALEDFVKRFEHIELETSPDFFDLFVEGCQFKPMSFPL
ncbi:MAG: DUF4445 domain-containing protein [Acidobacteria bacterium]|nr:DUF4445 domain-containing protein [Acidobacteriota bacterium]